MRTNVDSAKKRAVIQGKNSFFSNKTSFKGMDYDGFRQMVLGANLFPMKSKEVKELWTSDQKNGFFIEK